MISRRRALLLGLLAPFARLLRRRRVEWRNWNKIEVSQWKPSVTDEAALGDPLTIKQIQEFINKCDFADYDIMVR